MPLVRIDLMKGKPHAYREAIAEAIYRAMVEEMNVPKNDRFMVVTEHGEGSLVFDPSYLNVERTKDVVFIQITLNADRTLELKRRFYKRVVDLLAERPGVRPEDVFINLVEVPKENWSFGEGIAQYAT